MVFLSWASQNWVELTNVFLGGGVIFATVSLRSETKTRRINNQILLTNNHRELWTHFIENPSIARVLQASADVSRQPVTQNEEVFVVMIIQHMNSAFQAVKSELTIKPEQMCCDICNFLALPIPATVWNKMKSLQDRAFVKFIEQCHLTTK
jgi:hypothetical protein